METNIVLPVLQLMQLSSVLKEETSCLMRVSHKVWKKKIPIEDDTLPPIKPEIDLFAIPITLNTIFDSVDNSDIDRKVINLLTIRKLDRFIKPNLAKSKKSDLAKTNLSKTNFLILKAKNGFIYL